MYFLLNCTKTSDFEWVWKSLLLFRVGKRIMQTICIRELLVV